MANPDGYLDSPPFTMGAVRVPASFYIGSGNRISSVEFRLRPRAVLSGRIRLDDGEPAETPASIYTANTMRAAATVLPSPQARLPTIEAIPFLRLAAGR